MRPASSRRQTLILSGVLLAAFAHVATVMHAVYRPRTPVERKLDGADRVMYVRMDAHRGPRFALSGKERRIRLVTHAVLGDGDYDPRLEVVYGVRLELLAPGGRTVWNRDLYTSSHVSKAEPDGSSWHKENAFDLYGHALITDAREFDATLPDDTPANAVLRLRLTGGAEEGLVKLYDVTPRGEAARETALRALSPTVLSEMAERTGFLPFDVLSPLERSGLVADESKRLSAEGVNGTDYAIRQVFTTPFRESAQRLEQDSPLTLTRTHAVALDLAGPAQLRVRAWREGARKSSPDVAVISTRIVPANLRRGKTERASIAVPAGKEAPEQTIAVPAGLHSLLFTTDSEDDLRLRILAAPTTLPLSFSTAPVFSQEFRGERLQPLAPDERATEAWLATPDGPALELSSQRVSDGACLAFRLEARALLPAILRAEILDEAGAPLAHEEFAVSAPPAPFDRAVFANGDVAEISEPVWIRLALPVGGTRARLSASAPILVRASAQRASLPQAPRLDAPWDAAPLEGTIWRNAPLRDPNWLGVAPSNLSALVDAGRAVTVIVQTRLEEGAPSAEATPVAPLVESEKQVVLERGFSDSASNGTTLANWGAGTFTAIPANGSTRVFFGPEQEGAAEVAWWSGNERNVGARAELFVDDRPLGTFQVTSTGGRWRLPRVAPGAHVLRVKSGTPGLRLFVDQRPASPAGADVALLRTVHALGTEPLALRVEKPGVTPVTVVLVVYAPESGADPAPALHTVLDRVASSGRTFGLPAPETPVPAILPALGDRSAGFPRMVSVTLGTDVAPGTHLLNVTSLSPSVAWVRAYLPNSGPPDPFVAVERAHGAVFNVVGPVTLTIRARGAATGAASTFDVAGLHEGSSKRSTWTIPVPADAAETTFPLSLPAGVHSLQFSTSGERPLQVALSSAGDAPADFGASGSNFAGAAGSLQPDVRYVQAFTVKPEADAPAVIVDATRLLRAGSSVLRIDGWIPRPENTGSAAEIIGDLYAKIVDASGAEIGRHELRIRQRPSSFDRAIFPDSHHESISDPQTFRIVLPSGANRVLLTSSRQAAVRLYADPGDALAPDVLQVPWRDVPLAGTVWRYAPRESRSWTPVVPANQRPLLAADRWLRIAAQVRLERPPLRTEAVEITPKAGNEQQVVLERVTPEKASRALAAPGSALYSLLPPGGTLTLDIGRQTPGRASIQYWVDPYELGKHVTLLVDGRPFLDTPLSTSRGSWELPPISPGRHTLTAKTPARAIRLLVDQVPFVLDSTPLYRLVSVNALGSRPITLNVVKHDASPITVEVVVYAGGTKPRTGDQMRVVIDRGATRAGAHPTTARWTLPIPAADDSLPGRMASVKERSAGYPRRIPIVLGSDIPAGMHTIDVLALHADSFWLRAWIADPAAPVTEHAHQGSIREHLPTGGGDE